MAMQRRSAVCWGITLWLAGGFASPAGAQGQLVRTAQQAPNKTESDPVIRLDNTGVASWKYRNARNPPWVWDRATPAAADFKLKFVNSTSGATVKVALPAVAIPAVPPGPSGNPPALNPSSLLETPPATGPSPVETAQRFFGVKLDACETKDGGVVCTPTLTLAANAEGFVSGLLLANYPPKTVIKFRVTFPFALDSEQPSDQFGYFTLDKELRLSPVSYSLSASGSLALTRDPYFGAEGTVIDNAHVYDGATTSQVKGTGRTALALSLNDWATGTIEMQFKNGAFGKKDEDLAVKVNQYNFQVFGFTGTSLKFGKYLFAAPTDGLAINETGEGATARFRWFGVSQIVKRESQAGVADADNDDHKAWLLDASNIAVPTITALRSLSFYLLEGIDDTPQRERRYDTFGGEAQFVAPAVNVTGTIAYYRSHSRPHAGSPVRHADGTSWLARGSRSWLLNNKPAFTAALTVAQGSGDQSRTSDRYEGYLGETASYAPDGSLFLGSIVPRLGIAPLPFVVVDKDGKSKPEFTEKGLTNRRMIGATFSAQTFSPLEWVANLIQIPQKDVESRQTTIRLYQYSPTETVLGTRAGSTELQLEFLLESPKGVKYIVKYTHAFPRGPLEAVFPKEPNALLAQCNISLK